MKKNCTRPCFSNGSECGAWIDKNCDNCVKGSRYNAKNDSYTKIRCTIQEDIFTQYLGNGNDAIRQKSYDATRYNKCPHIIPIGTPRKKKYKVALEQQTLFEL
jgi:hypothetical protein